MSDKVFTEETHPNHKLIKALKNKGQTGIKVKWYGAMSFNYTKGWIAETDQNKWVKLGYDIKQALSKIDEL